MYLVLCCRLNMVQLFKEARLIWCAKAVTDLQDTAIT